ncbi:MAG: glycosyltransferase family 39 protein, partial [Planctomycetota bacterium]|nr:glycosyltransferase family 39 protein [Planctomycetota bacterium]
MRGLWRKPIFIIWAATMGWGMWSLHQGGCGVTWDEPTYTVAAAAYAGFLGRKEIPDPWRLNHEHPPLAKYAMAAGQLIWLLTVGGQDFLLMGGRLASWFFFSLLLSAIWLLLEPLGRAAAASAVLLCAACPRLVGEAQIATLDLPLASCWLWALWAYERATRQPRHWRWRVSACFLYGCAFLVKFSALALAPALLLWRLLLYALARCQRGDGQDGVDRGFLWGDIGLWCAMQAGAFLMLVIFWPWLWEDTAMRLLNYLRASLQHNMAPVLYLGEIYGAAWQWDAPPWHYAVVMLLVTTPIFVTAGAILGCSRLLQALWQSARGKITTPLAAEALRRMSLCAIAGAALPLATMMPGSVVYDG